MRPIDAHALSGKAEEMYIHTSSGKIIPVMAVPVWEVNNAPIIDAVEVVRCNDCAKRGNYNECPMCYQVWNDEDERFCGYHETADDTYDDFFCKEGLKR